MADRLRLAAAGAGVLALVALVAVPLSGLFGTALSGGWKAAASAVDGPAASAAATTGLIAVPVTLASVGIGLYAALATERWNLAGRAWLRLGMLLPLLVPGFVSALSWISAYGPGGLLHDLVGMELPGLFGLPGVIAVLVVETVPITYLVLAGSLAARAEPDTERAARMAGAGAWDTLRSVTLPLLAPALAAAAVLAFVSSVNAFGVPAILGTPARVVTVTVRIYQDLALSADPAAFVRVTVLASLLVVLALLAVWAADALLASRPLSRTAAPAGSPSRAPGGRLAAVGLWAYLVIGVIVPLVALALASVTRAVGLPPVPANWTLAHFAAVLDGRTAEALGNSLLLAIGAATTVVLLGALLVAMGRGRLGRGFGIGAALPFAVPGSALAVAVLLSYGPWLRDTLVLIGIAYVAKLWALGHRSLVGPVRALAGDEMRAARASGASRLEALRSIALPLLRPALLGAWLAVFVLALHELTMSSLLHGPGTRTLAVVILNLQQLGEVPATAALALLLTLIGLMVGGAYLGLTRRRPT